ELESLSDRLGDSVEHFGRVAAAAALNGRDERDLLELPAVHALDDDVQCIFERNAELLVGDHAAELAPRRIGSVLDYHGEGADEAVPGAKRGREHLKVVGELFGELLALPRDLAPDHAPDCEWNHQAKQRDERRAGDEGEEPDAEERADEREEHDPPGRPRDPGELELVQETPPQAGSTQESLGLLLDPIRQEADRPLLVLDFGNRDELRHPLAQGSAPP